LVTNAGSDEISVFTVDDALALLQTAPSGGAAPMSGTEHEGLVYVLKTGDPSVVGFTLGPAGLHAVSGSRRELATAADPAQVGFSPDGGTVVVTQRGTNSLVSFPVDEGGLLGDPQ